MRIAMEAVSHFGLCLQLDSVFSSLTGKTRRGVSVLGSLEVVGSPR